jgi:hypothetical protein
MAKSLFVVLLVREASNWSEWNVWCIKRRIPKELLLAHIYLGIPPYNLTTLATSPYLSQSTHVGTSEFTYKASKTAPPDFQNHPIRPQIEPLVHPTSSTKSQFTYVPLVDPIYKPWDLEILDQSSPRRRKH